ANNWDSSTMNWLDSGALSVYAEGANVTFDNTGSNTPAINFTATFAPNAVTVNSTNTYIFGGAGGLSGAMGLNQNGSGTLVWANTNTYFGNTTVNAGSLQLGNGSVAGNAGSGTIVLAGAALAGANGANSALLVNETGSPTFANALSIFSGRQAIYVNAGQT